MNNQQTIQEINSLNKLIEDINYYLSNLSNDNIGEVSTIEGIGDCEDVAIEFIHNKTLHFPVNNFKDISKSVRDLIKDELTIKLDFYESVLESILNPTIEYQQLIDFWALKGLVLPSSTARFYQDSLIRGLKEDGIWDKLESFYVFANNSKETAYTDWKRLITGLETGVLNFEPYSHIANIDNFGFNTSYNPGINAVSEDNFHYSVYLKEAIGTCTPVGFINTDISYCYLSNTAGNIIALNNQNVANGVITTQNFSNNSLYISNRNISGSDISESGVSLGTTTNGGILADNNMILLADSTSLVDDGSKLSFFSVGTDISGLEMTFEDLLDEYLSNIA